ncbi:uncharacterized protein LOC144754367 [Lissotriton helveticus]
MASFNVLFFTCNHSVCVRKDGDFLLLDNPGEVLCKWLVQNVDEAGRPITEERYFKAMILFQSSDVTTSDPAQMTTSAGASSAEGSTLGADAAAPPGGAGGEGSAADGEKVAEYSSVLMKTKDLVETR